MENLLTQTAKGTTLTKDEVHKILMRFYRMTIREVKQLTPMEQRAMLEAIAFDPSTAGSVLHFDSDEDYAAWRMKNVK